MLSAGIAEVYKLESNENLRLIVDSMQMPTVEYKEINMEDYSMYTIQQMSMCKANVALNNMIDYDVLLATPPYV